MRLSIMNIMMRTVMAALLVVGASAVQAADSERVAVDANEIFIPAGFDDNDQIVVVLDGMLRSGCYSIADTERHIDLQSNVIRITQYANRGTGPCTMALVPFTVEVDIGILPHGNFLVTTNDGTLSKEMIVNEALSAGPDDFLFAPLESVSVHRRDTNDSGEYFALLSGNLTTNCMVWDGVKKSLHDKTIVLQPIVKMIDLTVCEDALIPFRVAVTLPEIPEDGRYLVHTRSLYGQSINRVFTAMD